MRHTIPSGFSVRAVLLGLLLIIPNVFWTIYGEVVSQTDLNSTSLMMPPLCTLLVLLMCNAGVRRYRPGKELSPGELIAIYVIVTMATVLAGAGMLQFIVTTLPAGYHYGLVAKEIATVTKSLPIWAMPNQSVVEAFYKGNASVPWSAWMLPMLIWGGFLLIMVWTMLCMNAMFRKQWMERERLTYPIAQLPLEMTDPNAGFFKNRLLWFGIAVPVILESMNSLNALFPSMPYLQIRARELNVFFPDPPWNSMGPLQTTFYPLAIGLGYLLPADVSFSCAFFYIFSRLENVATAAFGLNQGGGNGAQWPFLASQGAGGFLGLAVMTVWLARKHLADVWRGTLHPKQADDADEPMSYRAACVGLLLGLAGLMAYGMLFKISPLVFGLYLLIFLAFTITITRLRVEAGPAWTMGPTMHSTSVTFTAIGSINMAQSDIHKLALFQWFSQETRCNPMPVSAEALKMQHGQTTPRSVLMGVLMLASVVGIIVGFAALLMVYYQNGAASSKVEPWRTVNGNAPYWLSSTTALNPRNPDWSQLGAMGVGGLVAVGLSLARTMFVWWPFHPAGYVLANTPSMDWLWMPCAVAWIAKISFLKLGGVKSYKQAMPFFMGLIIGDYVISALWALLGSLLRMPMYRCFPC